MSSTKVLPPPEPIWKDNLRYFLKVLSITLVVCGLIIIVGNLFTKQPPSTLTCYNQYTGVEVPCPTTVTGILPLNTVGVYHYNTTRTTEAQVP
jgi:hypothetical protein